MSIDAPFQQRCSNPGQEDRFTCPGCYEDHHGVASSITSCSKCGRALRCYVEQQPVATCELADAESEDDLCDDCELPVDICACEETDE